MQSRILGHIAAIAIILFSGGNVMGAQYLTIVQPMTGVTLLRPDYPPPMEGPQPYSSSFEGPSNWTISQYSNPTGAMPPFSGELTAGQRRSWTQGPSSWVAFSKNRGVPTLVLRQDGALLPCANNNGSPREFDLFGAPDGPHVKPPRTSALPLLGKDDPSIADMASLTLKATVAVVDGLAKTRKKCSVNIANTTIAVILSNSYVHPAQTLFFQLILSRLCGYGYGVHLNSCETLHKKIDVFYSKNPFGVDDYLPLNGVPWLSDGAPTAINLNVLPRIIAALMEKGLPTDPLLSHWTVRSMYFGQIIYGDVVIQSVWTSITLTAIVH